MAQRLDDSALRQLFLEARTHRAWLPIEVPDALLLELVDVMKWGPTASNTLPARIVFVRSKSAKERLRPLLAEGNRERTMLAPACAILGYDALLTQGRRSSKHLQSAPFDVFHVDQTFVVLQQPLQASLAC